MEPVPTERDPDSGDGHADLSVGDPVLGKSRLLSRQCDTCIFAPGNQMHLDAGQLRALIADARERGTYIICHDTLPHYRHPQAKPAICRGFADRYRTQALELIERIWGFVEVDPPSLPERHDSTEGTDR
ncbi:hypothetical protein [Micromonospora endolithica]|uniref:Uncharacterized protein n=1 Tax=Micromonospora endolithica TaxID=230091 RepID=A0A3A9ZCI6_9ACTN|nr:hypothetical protein D7223_14555 [Micromonospora endolithica]TWJ25134.1 hypothetical protein JD76_05297 [Micromonospora endolithica]